MAVITISRGTFSGGKALAHCLAEHLGYRSIEREAIIQGAAACGASEVKLREAIERPPGIFDHFTEERRRYMALFQACLAEKAREDGLIYLGNAGHLLLHGISHVLRVRIIAPLEHRVCALQETEHLEREEALAHIQKMDHDRARWTRFLYGVDWSDPALYDLVVNLERTSVDEACRTVAALAAQESFRFTPQAREAIEDLALSGRVRATLLTHPETSALVLEVEARGGTVTLRGRVRNLRQREAVEALAGQTAGVGRLVTAELVQVLDS
jgi:cytidylate kinase